MAGAARTARLSLGLMVFLLPAFASGVQAQNDESPYEQARTVYNAGEYDQAAELFDVLAQDETVDLEIRKESLRYLGRAHIAQGDSAEARQAVADLLTLEPPLALLDPDVEPPTLMNLYYAVRQGMTGHEVPKEDPGLRTLAIMDFRNYALDEKDRWDSMQWGFASMMIEQLGGATDLTIVERENLQYVLNEQDLQREPGRVDPATAVRMGKLMGAHAMVLGGIYIMGKDMRLSARVVKVETGEILLGESVAGKVKDVFELLEELSLKVARSVNSSLTETQIGARTDTRSMDAMQSYSEAMKLAERGDYRGARAKYLEALDHDPSYTRAERRAESLVTILAAMSKNTEGSDTGSSGQSGGAR
jgi:TolB-like protein